MEWLACQVVKQGATVHSEYKDYIILQNICYQHKRTDKQKITKKLVESEVIYNTPQPT